MARAGRWVLLLAAAAVIARAEEPAPAITGHVLGRERIAPPPGAVVRVRLEVFDNPERPPRRVAEVEFPIEGRQVPIPFTLPYDPARIVPDRRYRVTATIRSGDEILFSSRATYAVLTRGAPSRVDIVVEPAGSGARRPRTPTPGGPELAGVPWKLDSLGDSPAAAAAEIAFDRDPKQISGSTGCNRFFGTYAAGEGASLKLEPAGMTLMACAGSADAQEKAFLDALRATASYRISGTTLELLDGGGRVLARFARAAEAAAPAH